MRRMIVLLAAALMIPGCGNSPTDPGDRNEGYETDLTIPGNLLKNLVTSYERREIFRYSKLLAQDFTFLFQPGPDAAEFPDGLTREQDELFTGNMFSSTEVVEIRLDMTWDEPDSVTWKGEPALRIVLNDLRLDVELISDLILRVTGDLQQFYFRLGKENLGENPTIYYLVGWQDMGQGFAPGLWGAAVEENSWGRIKTRFREP